MESKPLGDLCLTHFGMQPESLFTFLNSVPKGTENGKGLVASGPVSFAKNLLRT